MYAALDLSTAGSRRPKPWPTICGKVLGRRVANQMIRRLPMLMLWTLVAIFLLFVSLQSNSKVESPSEPAKFEESIKERQVRSQSETPTWSEPTKPPNVRKVAFISTTKSPVEDYSRRGKVFILIVQDGNLKPPTAISTHEKFHDHLSSTSIPFDALFKSHVKVPENIRYLCSVLDSHRIEYSIDTTRGGLPATLLDDQRQDKHETKKHSVIIIDDFVRYTRLNPWVRDQLDRHCKTNNIGVIAFLTAAAPSGHVELTQRDLSLMMDINQKADGNFTGPQSQDSSQADRFPLGYRLFKPKTCRNATQEDCVINYQLNDKSSILRILKSRPNFTVSESTLCRTVNKSPWISMTSNHITYEPLSWARIRRRSSQADRRFRSTLGGTHKRDQRSLKVADDGGGVDKEEDEYSKNRGNDYLHEYAESELHDFEASDLSDSIRKSTNEIQPTSSDSNASDDSRDEETSDVDREILSMYDRGLYDGIKRVIFGGTSGHWLNRILFFEAIEHLSSGEIFTPLDRFIQIDIDDIFVGETGKRMNRSDVEYLIETQQKMSDLIEGGFKFNLGFSGKYFKRGTEAENEGDEELIKQAKEFTWFCHFWSHSKSHLLNTTEDVELELRKNLEFARQNRLPLIGQAKAEPTWDSLAPSYAVAPHHSGVYPIHEPLYEAWRKVLNVQVTSTEEYPHLRPAHARRAFVHKAIKVLPRQTCGLYTHTVFRCKYPGGFGRLESNIRGGELFESVLHNSVNIYMTHMSNYAHDRLAPYTFLELINFVRMNTNLKLRYASRPPLQNHTHPADESQTNSSENMNDANDEDAKGNQLAPMRLADYYFKLYPDELDPLWTNPCDDKRHLAIWKDSKRTSLCPVVPKLLIVGPQKTGTTALYSFLKMNPTFKSSLMSTSDFEEVQFFNDKHYKEGVDWYFERFLHDSPANSTTETIYFDKSATYFDDPKVVQRAHNLLPDANVVIMLVNPVDRAYSWYQHMKSHQDPIATKFTFEQVIMSSDNLPNVDHARIHSLRSRCLHPGFYAQHLLRWLRFFPPRQMIIIDGSWFKSNPAAVMNKLQLILRLNQPLDYKDLLIFDQHKGFYCQKDNQSIHSGHKCLGKSKGRKYAPMSEDARVYLDRYFRPHNKQLARLLTDIGQPLPIWLEGAMRASRSSSSVMY